MDTVATYDWSQVLGTLTQVAPVIAVLVWLVTREMDRARVWENRYLALDKIYRDVLRTMADCLPENGDVGDT